MPWKEVSIMDERTKFIGRLLYGEKMAPLCREFGISRVTGYKIWNRYKRHGVRGLMDRSRAPHRHPNRIPIEIEGVIVELKNKHPKWGAPKIREVIRRRYPGIRLPAVSTVHCILERRELTKRRKKGKGKGYGVTATYLSIPKESNDLWTTDFKGQFRLGNNTYCYPLTIMDSVSRYIIGCELLGSTKAGPCFEVFEEAFYNYGLPKAIRSDNGVPFVTPNSPWGMSRLSVWWVRLGIKLERIRKGRPQQNGRHERMHRTLKLETARPPAQNLLQQQERFDIFVERFNTERPHEALGMKCPAEVYRRSPREYRGTPEISYPMHDKVVMVTKVGEIHINGRRVYVGSAFAGQPVGVLEKEEGIWQVDFMEYTLGYFDEEVNTLALMDDPFGFREGVVEV